MSVRVWDLAEHRMKNVRKLKKAARSVTYSPDGRALAVIFKSGEDLGMSEWSAILENTQKSFERVSRVQGWMEYRVAFFKAKMLFFMPISAMSLKF